MEAVNLGEIKANKQQTIRQMYTDLENTAKADRFYTVRNIECRPLPTKIEGAILGILFAKMVRRRCHLYAEMGRGCSTRAR